RATNRVQRVRLRNAAKRVQRRDERALKRDDGAALLLVRARPRHGYGHRTRSQARAGGLQARVPQRRRTRLQTVELSEQGPLIPGPFFPTAPLRPGRLVVEASFSRLAGPFR